MVPHPRAVYPVEQRDGGDQTGDGGSQEAAHTVFDEFWNRSLRCGDDRSSDGHGFDHDHPERLGPAERVDHRDRRPQQVELVFRAEFTDVFDPGVQQRLDCVVEVLPLFGFAHLGGNKQWHSREPGYLDGLPHPLVPCHPAQEREIPARATARHDVRGVDAVVNDSCDVHGARGARLVV